MHELTGLVDRLAALPSAVVDDAERIDVIAALEKLKAAAGAAQAQIITQFAASQEAANTATGVPARHAARGVPEQVGLARRVSPAAAARQVTQARALIEQLPATFTLWQRGEISEHVATIVATETSHLAADDRQLVDKQLAGLLPTLSPKRAHAAARRLAIEADPRAAVQRAGRAREDRLVSIRPAPDTMAVLSALLPCEQGVAAYAALRRHADTLVGAGDGRSRDQIMADTLVERLTGQATADAVSAEIGLVMTDAALLAGDDTAADLDDYGPVPAELARTIARGCDTEQARVFVRRLFTDPAAGIVTGCDPRRRRFDGSLAKLLVYRDRTCRDPFCDAPIRHLDHIRPHAAGGATTPTNGRGVCERGNYVRHMPGWSIHLIDPRRHVVETTTPTGHRYRSTPPHG
ncbi:HNH endonuclease signature motif containing protein [Jiangella alkaliphila]|uniref:HNH nuclease domain-containing protein n=1 Tax=Jiangella alkaliphila TaxID=419479 RepID=A0A1H2LVU1_9ACTN|nr:DUF222 domain-containing protein [Jiangella alkaliphila]SDU84721.1 protein of unknown function [Jiangella alkaliphila]